MTVARFVGFDNPMCTTHLSDVCSAGSYYNIGPYDTNLNSSCTFNCNINPCVPVFDPCHQLPHPCPSKINKPNCKGKDCKPDCSTPNCKPPGCEGADCKPDCSTPNCKPPGCEGADCKPDCSTPNCKPPGCKGTDCKPDCSTPTCETQPCKGNDCLEPLTSETLMNLAMTTVPIRGHILDRSTGKATICGNEPCDVKKCADIFQATSGLKAKADRSALITSHDCESRIECQQCLRAVNKSILIIKSDDTFLPTGYSVELEKQNYNIYDEFYM